MKHFISLFLIGIFFIHSTSSWAGTEKIGALRKVSGTGFVQRAEQTQTIQALEGLAIYQNDTISTTDDASLGIVFIDATRISLGSNSQLTISKYIFNPSQKKFSMLTKMMKGTASFVSGKISKLSPGSALIETPDATIASRGTSFLIKVEER
ncbi:MAG: FecR domain-containing protein [Pseudomonadota bacterium]